MALAGDRLPQPAPWGGTERYEVLRCIGRGGMGVVYEALDRERRHLVAVKTLLHFSPSALYLFKQEFRTLADVLHPNLVRLYELDASREGDAFFTMELVRGCDFVAYGRRPEPRESAAITVDVGAIPVEALAAARGPDTGDVTARDVPGGELRTWRVPERRLRPPTRADGDRVRATLLQLAEGVEALHTAGKLHRDIKPSNVMVTEEGRVVLLDFGVATELSAVVDNDARVARLERGVVGTVAYIAPEQAAYGAPTTASDWYSVGVMLYEVLVGEPPCVGSPAEVLARKILMDPPSPRECAEGVPEDLDELCTALLRRDPEQRPSGPEILSLLRVARPRRGGPSPPPIAQASGGAPLVGRASHLRDLRDAFEATRQGRCVTIRVRGASGMGKSALIQHFLDGLVESGQAVALRCRVYERESVPYKAFDGVVDGLSQHLVRLFEIDGAVALPPDIRALARLFPVLRRVAAIDRLPDDPTADPRQVRRRAFVALRELLGRLSQRQPLVVYVDDVQWGDADSASLLLELVRPPRAPALLLIMTLREEESETSPFLTEIRNRWPALAEARDLFVGPLDNDDAAEIALNLLEDTDETSRRTAEALARESRGSAFLVQELARSFSRRAPRVGGHTNGAFTLEQMVDERLRWLPSPARSLMELVAVGARPLSVHVAGSAAGIVDGLDEVIALLRAHGLVRTRFRNGGELVEASHDRFRQTIVRRLSADTTREHHGRLARAIEELHRDETDALAMHLHSAGDRHRAARYAERAAEEAAAKLAFDQAIRLYRLALENVVASSSEGHRLRIRLAEVLEWAGRGSESAHVYLEAAREAPGPERAQLERNAAEQLLASGQMFEGTAVLRGILAAVGIKEPASPLTALIRLIVYRLALLAMGFRFRERDPDQVDKNARSRIEALYTAVVGFALVDVIKGACMQALHAIAALRAGDRAQVLRAISIEVTQRASAGGPIGRRERALTAILDRLISRAGTTDSVALAQAVDMESAIRGGRLYLRGRWREAKDILDTAFASWPNRRAAWHSNAQLFGAYVRFWLGDMAELGRYHARLFGEAEQRGDLLVTVQLRIGHLNIVWLAADDVENARRHHGEAMSQWVTSGYLVQHWLAMISEAHIGLYLDDGDRAYQRVLWDERQLARSFLMRVQALRAQSNFLRGRCAAASIAARSSDRRARLAEVARLVQRLEEERMPWTAPLADLVAAAGANAAGNREDAVIRLRAAIAHADQAEMSLLSTVAKHRLGALLAGDEGRELARSAEKTLLDQGIRAPSRFAAVILPGRWD
jgi:eukaryotic-like serine/threonine-protein kinase